MPPPLTITFSDSNTILQVLIVSFPSPRLVYCCNGQPPRFSRASLPFLMPTSAHHPRSWQTDNLYNSSAQMSTLAVVRLSPEPASRFVYDFLAHSPPPRTRPVEPLPPTPTVRATVRSVPRRRSSTVSAIASWTTPGSHAFAPVNSPAVSRRPSLVRSPRSARRHSATFHSFFSTPTHTHTHTADLHAPGYTSAIIQLPITPRAAAPRLPPSYFPSNIDSDMKFTLAATPRQREGSITVHASTPFPSTPAKRKGLMRFLRPGSHPRSTVKPPTHRQVPRPARPSDSPPSPTTDAFRIAHKKRAHYAKHGALPLPLEAEVEIMLFADGGSRADAIDRLGPTYTDAAGVVYSDETEAAECLPLLLAPELDNQDENHSDVFAFASSPPPSPLAPRTPPVLPSAPLTTSAQTFVIASSPRTLLSIPARASSPGGDAGAAAYLHLAFDPSSVSPARGRARRSRPAQLTLPLAVPTCLRPTVVIGFDDSFLPSCGAVSEASVVRDAEREFRGMRAMRRE
jgi:hypothetical protein